jgi:hypothetical protein
MDRSALSKRVPTSSTSALQIKGTLPQFAHLHPKSMSSFWVPHRKSPNDVSKPIAEDMLGSSATLTRSSGYITAKTLTADVQSVELAILCTANTGPSASFYVDDVFVISDTVFADSF